MKLIKTVAAHCDIPCGVYETDTLNHSTQTCRKMIEKIEELGELDTPEKYHTFVRTVTNKEKHAQKVKKELYILWSDYFKPEHLEAHPNLHDIIWSAVKQASQVKQTMSMAEVEKLEHMVHEVTHMYADTKTA